MGPDAIAAYAAAIITGLFAIGAAFMGGRYLQSNRDDEEEAEVQRALGRLEGGRGQVFGPPHHNGHGIKIVEERVNLLHGTISALQADIRENRTLLFQEQRDIRTLVTRIEGQITTLSTDVARLQSAVRTLRGRRYPPHKEEK